jgi:hypothetical protein
VITETDFFQYIFVTGCHKQALPDPGVWAYKSSELKGGVLSITLLLLSAVVFSSAIDAETPEDFLIYLTSSTADQWILSQCGTDVPPDTVEALIGSLTNLSVEPGERVLIDIEGGYRAEFNESRWTWRLPGGRIGSVTGLTAVEWHPGGYQWVTVPVFTDKGATLGSKEQICLGVTTMAAIGLVALVAIWVAKRRYR